LLSFIGLCGISSDFKILSMVSHSRSLTSTIFPSENVLQEKARKEIDLW
jgi:hypothetical protein